MVTEIVTPRIGALEPPHEPAVAAQLQKMMPPNVPPIGLFRTVVKNLPMAEAMTNGACTSPFSPNGRAWIETRSAR